MSRRYRIEITPTTAANAAQASAVAGTYTQASTGFNTTVPAQQYSGSNAFGFKTQTQSQSGLPAAFQSFFPLDSAPDGKTSNTSYLDVEFDLNSNSGSSQNQGAQTVIIKGVTPQMVAQAGSLNGMTITVYGGFAKGMPLATMMANLGFSPLVKGVIFGAVGSWVGSDIYLLLPIIPSNGVGIVDATGTVQYPDLTVNGKQGEKWAAVIERSIVQGMPGVKYVIDVSDNLVLTEDTQGVGYSLDALGQLWNSVSRSILGGNPNYPGIWVAWRAGVLYVTDNPRAPGTKTVTITAAQLLGNPAPTQPLQLQIMCPMRSDIYINDVAYLPADVVALAPNTVSTGQFAAANNASAGSLAGNYRVVGVRHLGKARSANALDWASVYDLVYLESVASSAPTNDGTQPFGQKTS
jgi:hypothetical protein